MNMSSWEIAQTLCRNKSICFRKGNGLPSRMWCYYFPSRVWWGASVSDFLQNLLPVAVPDLLQTPLTKLWPPQKILACFLGDSEGLYFQLLFGKRKRFEKKNSKIFGRTPKIDFYCNLGPLFFKILDKFFKMVLSAPFWVPPRPNRSLRNFCWPTSFVSGHSMETALPYQNGSGSTPQTLFFRGVIYLLKVSLLIS